MYNDTLPIEMAVVRSCGGKYRAATLAIEFSTSGWPSATTNCPARAQPYDPGPNSRSSCVTATFAACTVRRGTGTWTATRSFHVADSRHS